MHQSLVQARVYFIDDELLLQVREIFQNRVVELFFAVRDRCFILSLGGDHILIIYISIELNFWNVIFPSRTFRLIWCIPQLKFILIFCNLPFRFILQSVFPAFSGRVIVSWKRITILKRRCRFRWTLCVIHILVIWWALLLLLAKSYKWLGISSGPRVSLAELFHIFVV